MPKSPGCCMRLYCICRVGFGLAACCIAQDMVPQMREWSRWESIKVQGFQSSRHDLFIIQSLFLSPEFIQQAGGDMSNGILEVNGKRIYPRVLFYPLTESSVIWLPPAAVWIHIQLWSTGEAAQLPSHCLAECWENNLVFPHWDETQPVPVYPQLPLLGLCVSFRLSNGTASSVLLKDHSKSCPPVPSVAFSSFSSFFVHLIRAFQCQLPNPMWVLWTTIHPSVCWGDLFNVNVVCLCSTSGLLSCSDKLEGRSHASQSHSRSLDADVEEHNAPLVYTWFILSNLRVVGLIFLGWICSTGDVRW